MSYLTARLRRTAARLPRGTLMTLITLGMLVLTIGAARAMDTASGHAALRTDAATPGAVWAAIVGARIGETLRPANVRSVDLTNCEPVDDDEIAPRVAARSGRAPALKRGGGAAQ